MNKQNMTVRMCDVNNDIKSLVHDLHNALIGYAC